MSRFTTYLKAQVRRLLMARVGSKGIDLSQLDRVPDSLAWPLHRDGPDPVARLGELREQAPVAKLTSFLGMNVWLVTGEAEARAGAGGHDELQQRHPAVHGQARLDHRRRHRRPRLHRPARAHPAAQAADPRVHDAPPRAAAPADRRDRRAPSSTRSSGRRPPPTASSTWSRRFAFPIPFLVICELLGLPDEDRETFRQLGSARFDVSYGGQGVVRRGVGLAAVPDGGDPPSSAATPGDGPDRPDHPRARRRDQRLRPRRPRRRRLHRRPRDVSASMLALGTAVLLDHPDDYRRVGTDPAVVDRTVEELLRYLTVVQIAFPRFPKTRGRGRRASGSRRATW